MGLSVGGPGLPGTGAAKRASSEHASRPKQDGGSRPSSTKPNDDGAAGQARAGATSVGGGAKITKQQGASEPTKAAPAASISERLEAMRAERDPAKRSRIAHGIALDLENDPPRPEDFKLGNGRVLEHEYQDAKRYYADQLEEAQQAAKPERLRLMREELKQTPTGRQMLDFERRAGVPITVRTDREWTADGRDGALAVSVGDEGLFFKSRAMSAGVYVHEMTHQIDHRTKILAPKGDERTKAEVIAEATRKYREFGLDPAEVPAVVDATYHRPDGGAALTHGHTRLAGARFDRDRAGGPPLSDAEVREVLRLSVPREQDMHAVGEWRDGKLDDDALRSYARSRGISVDGRSADQLAEELTRRAEEAEARMQAISRGESAPPGRGVGGSAGDEVDQGSRDARESGGSIGSGVGGAVGVIGAAAGKLGAALLRAIGR